MNTCIFKLRKVLIVCFQGAINVPKVEDETWQNSLKGQYFSGQEEAGSSMVLIFHCEFSSKRGPALFDWFRKYDRKLKGEAVYPSLFYEHMYIMRGGYKERGSKWFLASDENKIMSLSPIIYA